MAIELQTFASGDTDYIPKMNANVLALTTVIGQLQTQLEAISGTSTLSVGMFLDALFNQADALIGPESYAPTLSGSTLIVSPGGMYLAEERTTVTAYTATSLSFLGRTADTYYIVVTAGQPGIRDVFLTGTIYSVEWTGTTFGEIVYLVPIFYDTKESEASRKSLALNTSPATQTRFASLDTRLETGEALAVEARTQAAVALNAVEALQTRTSVRKVGITVDATNGVKGAVQLDFAGTIVGWSCIADQVGSLQVEVSVVASAAPPAAPVLPDPVTNKISASAPIRLSTAQTASSGTAGVSTWAKDLTRWSVVQFRVISAVTLTRATLYLRIEEQMFPSPPEINPLEPVHLPELTFREGDR